MTAPANERVDIGPLAIDPVTFSGAVDAIAAMIERRTGGAVFTANADHVVMATTDEAFRTAYARADLAVADGMAVVWASRLLGRALPAKVSGSDLVGPLMGLAAKARYRVYLLGGAPGVAARAAESLTRKNPGLRVVGASSPRIDLDEPPCTRRGVVDDVRRADPDLVLVALGAPKQELWIHEVASSLRPAVLIGVGATLDFEAGVARRCPPWVSAAGLEWAYRLAHEPRRLWRRYLARDPKFAAVVLRGLLERGGLLPAFAEPSR